MCHFGNRLRKSDTQRYPVLDSFGPKMPWEVDERIKLTDGTLYRVFLYRSDPSQKPLRFSSQKRADESAANEGVEAPQETGAMWHAAQKNTVSCWGGAVYKHAASSTAESPVLDVTFIFFCTSIIEQTAEASNKMLSKALELAKVSRSGCLWLWSDVGPHVRSAENAFFYLRHLPQTRQQPVKVRYLAECHGKGVLDAMFAVTGCSKSGWIGRYAAKHQIDIFKDIVKASCNIGSYTSYQWSYNPYEWVYTWVTGVLTHPYKWSCNL